MRKYVNPLTSTKIKNNNNNNKKTHLLDVINNHTKFQLNLIRTQNFQSKVLGTAVTLKYNQGHCKWYELVKLNEYYHRAKFDIYHIYSVQENCNIKVFATYRHLASQLA